MLHRLAEAASIAGTRMQTSAMSSADPPGFGGIIFTEYAPGFADHSKRFIIAAVAVKFGVPVDFIKNPGKACFQHLFVADYR